MSPDHDNNRLYAHLFPVFEELGLPSAAHDVYLAALRAHPRPASAIARDAQIKRPHCYNILAVLEEKGLLRRVMKNGITLYAASPPEVLDLALREREAKVTSARAQLASVQPLLDRMRGTKYEASSVTFVRKSEGIKRLYEDTLRTSSGEILAFSDFDSLFPEARTPTLHAWIWEYAQRRASLGIHYRGIVNRSSVSDRAWKRRKVDRREMKMLEGISLPAEVNIYDDKVSFLVTTDVQLGIVIQNAVVAETLRNIHQSLWKLLPSYRPRSSKIAGAV